MEERWYWNEIAKVMELRWKKMIDDGVLMMMMILLLSIVANESGTIWEGRSEFSFFFFPKK